MESKLDGFATDEVKEKLPFVEKLARLVLRIDKMSMQTRVNLVCYLFSIVGYFISFATWGPLGIFIFSLVSILAFYRIPFLTVISSAVAVTTGIVFILFLTGLGEYVVDGIHWLLDSRFAEGLK